MERKMHVILATILLFHLAFANAAGVSREETLSEFASLCPFSNFCEGSSAIKNRTQQNAGSCCQKCSCDSNCYTVGTCCPGVEHLVPENSQIINPKYTCVFPKQLLTSARNITAFQYSGAKYRIVDSCPDKNKSERFPSCENPEILGDYVLVSDIANDYVFKNKHCAACNGVVDVTNWTLLITSCPELMMIPFESIRDRNDYILKHCELDASPPDTINVETATCYRDRDIVSKCNETKKWDVYNKALEKACLEKRPTQNTIFKGNLFKSKFEFQHRYQKYSNVYCYLCNIKSNHERVKEKMCEIETPSGFRYNIFVSFSAVLDFREHGFHDSVGKDSRCSSMNLWDPNDNVCRPLKCPIGSMPVYGSCLNLAMSTSGYSLIFFLDLEIHDGNSTIFLKGWDKFEQRILKKIPGECGVCQTEIFNTGNISTPIFTMSIQLYTTLHCSTTRVFEYVKSLVMEGTLNLKSMYLNSTNHISLSVTMDEPDSPKRVYHLGNYYTQCSKPLPIQMHHLQNCRRFVIPMKVFSDFGFNSSLIETTKDLSIVTDNAHISICVRIYFKLRQSMIKSNAGIWPPSIVVIAVVVLCSFVC